MNRSVFCLRTAVWRDGSRLGNVFTTLVFALVSCNFASAAPTTAPLFGPTGLGTIPTTATVPANSLEVSGIYENVRPDVGRTRFFPELSATYGFNRGEIGVGTLEERFSASGLTFDRRYRSVHAKYRVLESKNSGGALALGAQQLDFSRGGDVTTLSLSGSYPLRISPLRLAGSDAATSSPSEADKARLHFGVFYHRVQNSGNETRPFIGIEAPLIFGAVKPDSASQFSLAADYAPRAGDIQSLASIAVRFNSPAGLGAQIGVGSIGGDRKIFAGLSYRFRFSGSKSS